MTPALNVVREKLARDEVVRSVIVRLVPTIDVVALMKAAGFDAFYVDLEHSVFDLNTAAQLCQAGLALGITPFVRVPAVAEAIVARILDAGALGVIAPHIQSPEEAERVVRLAKYPPRGERSAAGVLPHYGYRSLPYTESMKLVDAETTVVAMIESQRAVDVVDEILAVDGIDMLLIGAGDLSLDLGTPGDVAHPKMQEAHLKVIEAARKRSKHVGLGGLVSAPDLISRYVRLGARYISAGTDFDLLRGAAAERARQAAAWAG